MGRRQRAVSGCGGGRWRGVSGEGLVAGSRVLASLDCAVVRTGFVVVGGGLRRWVHGGQELAGDGKRGGAGFAGNGARPSLL